MATKADNNGAGSSIDKHGLAAAYRLGIGTADEFLASLYYLNNDNGINYGMPWIKPRATDTSAANTSSAAWLRRPTTAWPATTTPAARRWRPSATSTASTTAAN